jgi:hypothetical protein
VFGIVHKFCYPGVLVAAPTGKHTCDWLEMINTSEVWPAEICSSIDGPYKRGLCCPISCQVWHARACTDLCPLQVCSKSTAELQKLMWAAHYYDIQPVYEGCTDHILKTMCPANAVKYAGMCLCLLSSSESSTDGFIYHHRILCMLMLCQRCRHIPPHKPGPHIDSNSSYTKDGGTNSSAAASDHIRNMQVKENSAQHVHSDDVVDGKGFMPHSFSRGLQAIAGTFVSFQVIIHHVWECCLAF